MARVGGGGGTRWVWPLVIVLILVGLALIAWAFLAQPAPVQQPTGQNDTTGLAEPAPAPALPPSIGDITEDPSQYFGAAVTVVGRITRTVGDRGLFVADRNGGNGELLAVLDRPIGQSELQQGDTVRLYGTIMEVTGEELDRLEPTVDKPTLDSLAQAKSYLAVAEFVEEIEIEEIEAEEIEVEP